VLALEAQQIAPLLSGVRPLAVGLPELGAAAQRFRDQVGARPALDQSLVVGARRPGVAAVLFQQRLSEDRARGSLVVGPLAQGAQVGRLALGQQVRALARVGAQREGVQPAVGAQPRAAQDPGDGLRERATLEVGAHAQVGGQALDALEGHAGALGQRLEQGSERSVLGGDRAPELAVDDLRRHPVAQLERVLDGRPGGEHEQERGDHPHRATTPPASRAWSL
jgi:hypothetical protein